MFLVPGTTILTERGQRERVKAPLGDPGGQGSAFSGINLRTGEQVAVKVFKDASPELWARCQHLVALDLGGISEVFAAPIDLFRHGGMIGHVARLVPGKPLKERLQEPILEYPERIRIAIGVAHLVALLHERDAIHGDIQSGNFMVSEIHSGLEICGIDFDNLVTAKFPTALMAGQAEFFAPEIRKALALGQRVHLTKDTDSYALAVMLHDVLLWKHPASGAKDPDDFESLMQSPWAFDPVSPRTPEVPGDGFPVRMLSPALAAAFRGGLSPDPARRPSPAAWRKLLSDALFQVFVHDCGGPVFVSGAINECPFCTRPFPKFGLHDSGGGLLVLIGGGDVRIGRKELRGSTTAKPLEAVGRKIGPETYLEVLPGGSGVFRLTRAGAIRIPEGRRALLKAGDVLRIADIECHVQPEGGYCARVVPVKAPTPPPPPVPPPPIPKRRVPWGVMAKFAGLVAMAFLWIKTPDKFWEEANEKTAEILTQLRGIVRLEEESHPLLQRPEWIGGYTNSLGMVFRAIPGSEVKVSIWETRVMDYRTFCTSTGRAWSGSDRPAHEPAAWVNWHDAVEFCRWLTRKERAEGKISHLESYQLPATSTWRLAAGFPNRADLAEWPYTQREAGNFIGPDRYGERAPVGEFAPNSHGFYDLVGNVWEWAADVDDPRAERKALLGGSWADDLRRVKKVQFRVPNHPSESTSGNVGFRCVLIRDESMAAEPPIHGGNP